MIIATATMAQMPSLSTNGKRKITWHPNTQVIDIKKIDNPLGKTKNQLVFKSVDDLIDEAIVHPQCKAAVDFHVNNFIKYKVSEIPKPELIRLGDYLAPEEVQRLLDKLHIANICNKFDPRLLSPIYVVRLIDPETKEVIREALVFDSMHTLTVIGIFAKYNLFDNVPENYLDFEYPAWVIETDDESFSSIAALYRNGEGSKPWGAYDYHRVYNNSFKFYNNPGPNGAYKLAYEKQMIMEREKTIPLPKGHPDAGKACTLMHIDAVAKYTESEMPKFEYVISNNNKFWHGSEVDSSIFGFYSYLYEGFKIVNYPTVGPAYDKFMDDIHAIIKTFFTDMSGLRTTTTQVYKSFLIKQNKSPSSPPHDVALSLVLKIYKRLGGTHPVPSYVNSYIYQPSVNLTHDLYDFLPQTTKNKINGYFI